MADTTTSVVVPGNRLTLLDIVKKNGSDAVVGLVDETVRAVPEVNLGAARTITGINYKTLLRKSLPTVAFRDFNGGGTVSKSVYETKLVETFLMNPRIEVDKALADSDEDGPEAALALEGAATMQASLQLLGRQFYYGRPGVGTGRSSMGGDAKGFYGLLDYVDSSLVVDAGGTTNNTASSVWFVAFGQQKVQWVWGNNGQLSLEPTRIESLVATDGSRYTGYLSEIIGRPGLQVLNKYSLIRIKNLTADSGKGLTDALLGQALALLPAAFRSSITDIFMAPRSQEQLRASRTTYSPTGQPAPMPDSFQGIPISISDSISITEPTTLA
jgi:hypothetical protein